MPGQYFDPRPDVASRPGTVTLDVPGLRAALRVDRGVFSAARVDPGTVVLLRALPALPAGTFLDLGCGYGPIACALAARTPGAQIWAVDVNERALELAAANAADLGLGAAVRTAAPEAVPGDVHFDAIVSNPPIRIGKAALHQLLDTWLPRLAPGASAWLVVQRHLGADSLAERLRGEGWAVNRRASKQAYRVLEVAAA